MLLLGSHGSSGVLHLLGTTVGTINDTAKNAIYFDISSQGVSNINDDVLKQHTSLINELYKWNEILIWGCDVASGVGKSQLQTFVDKSPQTIKVHAATVQAGYDSSGPYLRGHRPLLMFETKKTVTISPYSYK